MEEEAEHPSPQGGNSNLRQYLFTIAATLVAFCAGTALGWSGPALAIIIKTNGNETTSAPFTITSDEGSWVGSLLNIGALVGALPTGPMANIVGRKLVLVSLAVPFLISWIIIFFTTSATFLFVARIIMGLATGASSAVVPMYIGEIAETSIRGSLGSFFQLMLTIGILYTYVVGGLCSYTTLAVLNGIIPIIFFIMFISAPESPVYLLKKGKQPEAEASLKRLRGPSCDVSPELGDMQKEIDTAAANKTSFAHLFSRKSAFRALIASLGMMLFQQLSGINTVIFYANSIFKDAGSTVSSSVSAMIVGLVQVIATYVSVLLVDRAGRKILLLISGVVMGICLLVLGLFFHMKDEGKDVQSFTLIPLLSVALYIIVFALGFGPIPWMMTGELFTSDVKAPAVSMAVALNWFLAFVVTKTFIPLRDLLGLGLTFGTFGIINFIGAIFVILFVPETKGKTLEEIQQMLG